MLITNAVKRIEKKTGIKVERNGDWYLFKNKHNVLSFCENINESISFFHVVSHSEKADVTKDYGPGMTFGKNEFKSALRWFN